MFVANTEVAHLYVSMLLSWEEHQLNSCLSRRECAVPITVCKEPVLCNSCVKHLSGLLQTMHTSISSHSPDGTSWWNRSSFNSTEVERQTELVERKQTSLRIFCILHMQYFKVHYLFKSPVGIKNATVPLSQCQGVKTLRWKRPSKHYATNLIILLNWSRHVNFYFPWVQKMSQFKLELHLLYY